MICFATILGRIEAACELEPEHARPVYMPHHAAVCSRGAHDLVDIPGWTHGAQVQAIVERRRLWLATLVNAIFPGLAVAFAKNSSS